MGEQFHVLPAALRTLLEPPPGLDIDFSSPAGAPALVAADSVSWQIFANPIALFIGGVAAVLLELAEPAVRSGVWDHSNFRRDPVTRLRRTGFAALVTVYAPCAEAQRMIAQVVRMHDRVTGITPEGAPYHANDPHLLRWVHATALWGFAEAYHRYVTPLTGAQKDSAFAEGREAARLYGVKIPPNNWAEWERLLEEMTPSLEDSAVLGEFLELMDNAPILPGWTRPLQRLLVRAAVELVPAPVRQFAALESRRISRSEARLVRGLGRSAGLVPLPGLPPAQARKRMACPLPSRERAH